MCSEPVFAAHRRPDNRGSALLVDGGLPLDLGPLARLPIEELVGAIIGPSLQRLRMTFASVDEYLDFWRPHPALRDSWNAYIEEYLRYDLVGTEPELRSGAREDAVLADSQSDLLDGVVERAVLALRHPAIFLRAPRGLGDAAPLFADETVARRQREVPDLVARTGRRRSRPRHGGPCRGWPRWTRWTWLSRPPVAHRAGSPSARRAGSGRGRRRRRPATAS